MSDVTCSVEGSERPFEAPCREPAEHRCPDCDSPFCGYHRPVGTLCRACGGLGRYERAGRQLDDLVDSKQRQYGDSAGRSASIFAVLYPSGIRPHQYRDALLMVRVCDKLSRIAQRGEDGRDLGGESPWQDIAGYGLLGAEMERGHQ